MKEQIASRFMQNISRVRNLVKIYEEHLTGEGQGRRGHAKTDVLRSAVVLLHAATEDLLRSLAYWKLPAANAKDLEKIPLITFAPGTKYTLGDLSTLRGMSVDDVIKASVDSYLDRSNYNNMNEVSSFLKSIGVSLGRVNERFTELEDMMKRRHQIVHRADMNEAGGQGNHKVSSIGQKTVNKWIDAVECFGKALLDEIAA